MSQSTVPSCKFAIVSDTRSSRPVILTKLRLPKPSEMLLLPGFGNLPHLPRRHRECQRSQVVTHPLFFAACRDRYDPLVDTPPQ